MSKSVNHLRYFMDMNNNEVVVTSKVSSLLYFCKILERRHREGSTGVTILYI